MMCDYNELKEKSVRKASGEEALTRGESAVLLLLSRAGIGWYDCVACDRGRMRYDSLRILPGLAKLGVDLHDKAVQYILGIGFDGESKAKGMFGIERMLFKHCREAWEVVLGIGQLLDAKL